MSETVDGASEGRKSPQAERLAKLREHLNDLDYRLDRWAPEPKWVRVSDPAAAGEEPPRMSTTPHPKWRRLPEGARARRGSLTTGEIALLEELQAFFSRFLYLQPGDALVLALWVLFDHTHDCHRHSPRLFIWSPTFECGKSTALQILELLVVNPFPAVNPTEAVIFRAPTLMKNATMLYDEADTWLKDGNSAMVGVLNSGFGPKSLAKAPRMNMDTKEIEVYQTWAPTVFASRLKKLEGGLVRRSIKVSMMKASASQEPEEFISEVHSDQVRRLKERVAQWAEQARGRLKGAKPAMPAGLKHRDTYRPLFAIAECFGSDYVERLSRIAFEKTEAELNVQLLRDLRAIFETKKTTRMHSETLCNLLVAQEDGPWAEIMEKLTTAQARKKWLSSQLGAFEIQPEDEAWLENGGKRPPPRAASLTNVRNKERTPGGPSVQVGISGNDASRRSARQQ
jgi:hypothetical protein